MRRLLSLLLTALLLAAPAGCEKKPSSIDLDGVKDRIEEEELFGPLIYPQGDELTLRTGIEADAVSRGIAALPVLLVHANACLVLLPANGREETLKEQVASFLGQYEASWANYLPAQEALVKNRLETEISTKEGAYIVVIISEENEKVLGIIESCLIE